ncbi:MAG TPA: hypothetical protein VGX23_15365 [Actinocrinis sp.]|nr:hypothetical protein [Actinocrinis sp.]
MARRSPGEIRAHLRRHRRIHGSREVIRGLSAATNRQISQFERRNSLAPGTLAGAFRTWTRPTRRAGPHEHHTDGYGYGYGYDYGYDYDYGTTIWQDMHARTLLEAVLHTMSPKATRELRRAIAPLDARYLASTLNNPFAGSHLPWWLRWHLP